MFREFKTKLAFFFYYCVSSCAAQARFTDGDLAGAIIGSILSTLIACCVVAFLFYWLYIRRRDGKVDFEDATKPGYRVGGASREAPHSRSSEHDKENIVLSQRRPNGQAQLTYVNSGFQHPDGDEASDRELVQRRHYHNEEVKTRRQPAQTGYSTAAVRSQSTLRRRLSCGDKLNQKEDREHIKVKLRGHDFTGLGFNICGNLRDGIYVQNVLQKGPAADSGVLEPGDRIMDVRVSFKNIVFEDALTILSYASPYDVTLSVKKDDVSRGTGRHPSSDQTNRRSWQPHTDQTKSTNDRLYFPLKRSQSNGDLDAISRRSSTGSPEAAQYSPIRQRRVRRSSTEERAERRRQEEAAGYASIVSLHRASPTSSIRHVLTTPSVSGRDVRRQREQSVPIETTKETSEETVIFSKPGSSKKKPAPPIPPPPPQIHHYRLGQINDVVNYDDDEAFPPPPRPFSSVSESSDSSAHSRRVRRGDSQQEESRSVGASSMLNEIFHELEQDRSRQLQAGDQRSPTTVISAPKKNTREYQTFEMVWTEGSESETSSVYDKSSEREVSRKDSGFPLTEHTYMRQPYSPQISLHDVPSARSPPVHYQPISGTRLILPINMEPSLSISTPTSFSSEEEMGRRSGAQSRVSYGDAVRKSEGQQSPTKRLGTSSPNFR